MTDDRNGLTVPTSGGMDEAGRMAGPSWHRAASGGGALQPPIGRPRTGNGPQAMAILRDLGIAIFKLAGTPNIAAACRSHARDATRVLATLRLSTP